MVFLREITEVQIPPARTINVQKRKPKYVTLVILTFSCHMNTNCFPSNITDWSWKQVKLSFFSNNATNTIISQFFLPFSKIVHSDLLMIFYGFKNWYSQRTSFGLDFWFYSVLGLLPNQIGAWLNQLSRLVQSGF